MAASTSFPQAFAASGVESRTESIPWYIWLAAVGVASSMIGVQWDISWHESIGRDTFWTPAHMAIQLCGVIAGITCGYLILATTFTKSALRAVSVNVLGFRAPLGAFICAWGGFTMITSAPFDDWWHNAYGLDVKILSPPHMVLAAGIAGVQIGALVLIGALMNRSSGIARKHLEWMFLYVTGMIVVMLLTVELELTSRVMQHTAMPYRAVGMVIPLVLALGSRATGNRWAATISAGIYTAFLMALEWILPLFPAQPKLGPVFFNVTQFIPTGFPLLILAPAIALDLLWPRIAQWGLVARAAVSGLTFTAVFLAVQWPFASFLNSPLARNSIFGSQYVPYFESPKSFMVLNRFVPQSGGVFMKGLAIAVLFSMASSLVGMAAGDWLKRVRR
ncbi:MAG TPA: hypothetical protein VEF06_07515 [Bryobacteraceae bacterium]|nr:hypothetical protein [Bryobacteraceae bacterium]